MTDEKKLDLKKLERSLLSADNSFGLLTSSDFIPPDEFTMYSLAIAVVVKNKKAPIGKWTAVSYNVDFYGTDKYIISMDDLFKVFSVFKKCKRELICAINNEFPDFNLGLDKYIQKLKSLNLEEE